MNILVVWDRMGDYHRSRIEAYRALFPQDHLYTADLGAADQLYKWDNTKNKAHFMLSNKEADASDFWQRFKNFKAIVKSNQIDKAVISGYGRIEYVMFTIWLKSKGIDTYIFAESWYNSRPILDAVKKIYLNRLVKGFFVSGKRAEHHFNTRFACPLDKIKKGYSVVDNAHFKVSRNLADVEQNIASKPTLLCVARYSEEKNLEQLIQGFKISELSKTWKLKLVGGGPLKDKLQQQITNFHNIEMLDWQSYQDLPEIYKSASAFILPSTFEPWGLVVNEAMSASLPIIVSEQCGCKPDLLNANGYSFNAENQESLVKALNQLYQNNALELYDMGLKSQQIIRHFSPESWSKNLKEIIKN